MMKQFFDQLKVQPQALLLIDYDGTLAPFAIERDKAFPYEGVQVRIEQLQTVGKTKVIIVTGRAIQDLLKVFHPDPMPEIWGSHGGERLIGKKMEHFKHPKALKGMALAKKLTLHAIDPHQCEIKPLSIAVHWRGLNEESKSVLHNKAQEVWSPLVKLYPLEILPFNEGIELRQKGVNKATAVNLILKQEKQALAAYLGDDFTDEQAFAALGDRGLKILVSKQKRDSLADFQISSTQDLFFFFDKWLQCRQELP